ncbi:MAG: response regulator [Rhodospirillales bacterium]|nr:MAG: response regulator [Rhodospirillales bacterium]
MSKILVVEDIDKVRKAVVAVLEGPGGHDVISARDGQEGLSLLDQHTFDVAITDIWMPGEDGIAFLRQAKAKHPELPVIVITGGGPNFPPMEMSLAVVKSHGADAVLIKPFENAELLAVIETVRACP